MRLSQSVLFSFIYVHDNVLVITLRQMNCNIYTAFLLVINIAFDRKIVIKLNDDVFISVTQAADTWIKRKI